MTSNIKLQSTGWSMKYVALSAIVAGVLLLLHSREQHHLSRQATASVESILVKADDFEVLKRFKWATKYIKEAYSRGVYLNWNCSESARIGFRPAGHSPSLMGNTCEPWVVRPVVGLLHELLLPGDAKALEWSSGSSTMFLLMGHVKYLISIEHEKSWADDVETRLKAFFGEEYLREHWEMHHFPEDKSVGRPVDYEDERENPARFKDYPELAFLDSSHIGTFDYISVDGVARVASMPRALQLLKPQGGILVLDNSDRDFYAKGIEMVPKHWPFFEWYLGIDKTTVWISCEINKCLSIPKISLAGLEGREVPV